MTDDQKTLFILLFLLDLFDIIQRPFTIPRIQAGPMAYPVMCIKDIIRGKLGGRRIKGKIMKPNYGRVLIKTACVQGHLVRGNHLMIDQISDHRLRDTAETRMMAKLQPHWIVLHEIAT